MNVFVEPINLFNCKFISPLLMESRNMRQSLVNKCNTYVKYMYFLYIYIYINDALNVCNTYV